MSAKSTKERVVKMSWEDLADVLRKSGHLLGEEESIQNITLMKPKQVFLRLERGNGKGEQDVSR